jgi:hypothetical protein
MLLLPIQAFFSIFEEDRGGEFYEEEGNIPKSLFALLSGSKEVFCFCFG